MSVDIGSCGPWSARVQSVTVDYSEPTPGGIIRDGAGSFATEAFVLAGGDYVVAYELNTTSGSCDLEARLVAVGEDFGWVGEVSGEATKQSMDAGETRFFAVDPGRYYWDVEATSFDEEAKCRWTLMLTGW